MQIDRNDISILTIGLRFERSFRITDIMGNIFDCILRDSGSPFSPDFFPNFQEISSHDKVLINGETGSFFRLTTTDILFRHTISKDKSNLEKELKWFQKDAIGFIIDKIINTYNIKNFVRIGFLVTHLVEEDNIGGIVLSKISDEINKADQFTLTYGRKDPTVDGLVKKGVNDYVNRITLLKQLGEKEYDISLDYQYYFLPQLEKISGWPINDFFVKAYQNLDEKFYTMVNQLINETVGIK